MPWSRELDVQEVRLERAIAGGHLPTVAKAVLAYADLWEAVLHLILGEIVCCFEKGTILLSQNETI